jgi:DNA-binding XRE family transcriptional regulator
MMVGMDTMTDTLIFTLGEQLHVMRERAGLTQKQLADLIELSRNSVVNYERDIHTPKWMVVRAWAEACGFDAAVARESWERARLFGWTHGSPPPDDGPYTQLSWVGGSLGSKDAPKVTSHASSAA